MSTRYQHPCHAHEFCAPFDVPEDSCLPGGDLKTDPLTRERVIRYESKMRDFGMRKVAVWVPTMEAAMEIKRIAASMRKQHNEGFHGKS